MQSQNGLFLPEAFISVVEGPEKGVFEQRARDGKPIDIGIMNSAEAVVREGELAICRSEGVSPLDRGFARPAAITYEHGGTECHAILSVVGGDGILQQYRVRLIGEYDPDRVTMVTLQVMEVMSG